MQFKWPIMDLGLTSRRDNVIAGLRGMAVILVLVSHLGLAGIKFLGFVDFSGIGKSGVILFFILSAYLLTSRFLLINKSDVTEYFKYILIYIIRRILRILPLYTIVVAVFFTLSAVAMVSTPFGLDVVREHLLMKAGVLHLWAVPVEMKFYALLPVIITIRIILIKINSKIVYLVDGLFVIISYFCSDHFGKIYGENSINLKPYLFAFSIGYICAVIDKINIQYIKKQNYTIIYYMPLILMAVILCSTPSIYSYLFNTNIRFDYFHDRLIEYSLILGIIVYIGISYEFFAEKVVTWYPIKLMGTMSFSFYLWHPFIIEMVQKIPGINDFFKSVILLAIIFPFCCVSYLYVEKTFIKLSHKIKL